MVASEIKKAINSYKFVTDFCFDFIEAEDKSEVEIIDLLERLKLTKEEAAIINLLSCGYSCREISTFFGLNKDSIYNRIYAVQEKYRRLSCLTELDNMKETSKD